MSKLAIKTCEICHAEFFRTKNDRKHHWEARKFCSTKCANSRANIGQFKDGHIGYRNSGNFKTGHKTWNKGKQHMAESNNPLWKGDAVGYHALHRWVTRKLGQPTTCARCNKQNLSKQKIHWANKTGRYCRVLDDWIRLCSSCHRTYDISNHLVKTWQKVR